MKRGMGQGERCTRIMTHGYIGAGTDESSNEAFIDRRYKESADWILSFWLSSDNSLRFFFFFFDFSLFHER